MSKKGPIIIVEDDPDDQQFLRECLGDLRLENEVIIFPNGKDALEYLKTTTDKPFIILSDINMPVMDGLEFRSSINNNEYLRRKSIPFIFFSTADPQHVVNAAYDMTVQGFFKKMNTFGEVKNTLDLIITYWAGCRHPNSDQEN